MTEDYIRIKIKEALKSTGGDKHDAQKLLITWAVRDQNLLLSMTKPHLKAIAAGLIEHESRKGDASEADTGPDRLTRTAIDDIVASATGRRSVDKRSGRASNIPPPKSTERQANAMRKLAAAFTRKKK